MTTPGIPDRFQVVEIQHTPRTEPPSEPPPKKRVKQDSDPPIVVQGHGWKITAPVALLVAAAGLFTGRQTAPDPSAQLVQELKLEMRVELADVKRDVAAIKERVMRDDNVTQNRLSRVEDRLKALEP